MADASYWLYLIHLPIVLALLVVVADWNVNPFVKRASINAATIAFLWVTYDWFVRYSWIGRVLNGPRQRPRRWIT